MVKALTWFAMSGTSTEMGEYDDADGAVVTQPLLLPGNDGTIRMTARVRVVDESGRSDTTEVTVEIDSQNLAPVADAGGPYSTGPVK